MNFFMMYEQFVIDEMFSRHLFFREIYIKCFELNNLKKYTMILKILKNSVLVGLLKYMFSI